MEADKNCEPLVTKKSPFKEVPAEIRKVHMGSSRSLVCEVRFNEWTSDRKLRAPVFPGIPGRCGSGAVPVGRRSMRVGRRRGIVQRPRCPAGKWRPRKPPEIAHLGTPQCEFTNLDKVFWPEDGYTKGDLIDYYDRIVAVPDSASAGSSARVRTVSRRHSRRHFYQKDAPDYTPDWIRTQEIWSADVERHIRYFIGADRDQLLYIANMGASSRIPGCRVFSIWIIRTIWFSISIRSKLRFATVQKVALILKSVLDELGLRGYPKTSGASGIHVHLPILENTFTYEDVRVFAEAIASIVVQRAAGAMRRSSASCEAPKTARWYTSIFSRILVARPSLQCILRAPRPARRFPRR